MSAGYVYILDMLLGETRKAYDVSYTYRRGLLRCSFYSDGQCEGLK